MLWPYKIIAKLDIDKVAEITGHCFILVPII